VVCAVSPAFTVAVTESGLYPAALAEIEYVPTGMDWNEYTPSVATMLVVYGPEISIVAPPMRLSVASSTTCTIRSPFCSAGGCEIWGKFPVAATRTIIVTVKTTAVKK